LAEHAFGRPMAAAVGLMAAAVVTAVVVVMLVAMLGGRDRRSPFERLALIICVITGRRPGDYLPPASGYQDHLRPGRQRPRARHARR
jgi:hypothetical protein